MGVETVRSSAWSALNEENEELFGRVGLGKNLLVL